MIKQSVFCPAQPLLNTPLILISSPTINVMLNMTINAKGTIKPAPLRCGCGEGESRQRKAFLKWLKVNVMVDKLWDIADELNEKYKEKKEKRVTIIF